jgi:hypothetical protein
MTELGPEPLEVALAVAAGVLAGALVVLLPGDAHVRTAVRRSARRARDGVVGATRRG